MLKSRRHHTAPHKPRRPADLSRQIRVLAGSHSRWKREFVGKRRTFTPSQLEVGHLSIDELILLELEAMNHFSRSNRFLDHVTFHALELRKQAHKRPQFVKWLAENLGEACGVAIGSSTYEFAKLATQAVLSKTGHKFLAKNDQGRLWAASLVFAIQLSKEGSSGAWAMSLARGMGQDSWLSDELKEFRKLVSETAEDNVLGWMHEADRGISIACLLSGTKRKPATSTDRFKILICQKMEQHPDWGHRQICGEIDSIHYKGGQKPPLLRSWEKHRHDGLVTSYDCANCRPSVQRFLSGIRPPGLPRAARSSRPA
jgi:hypothetical protein